jgi:hypothetical protein
MPLVIMCSPVDSIITINSMWGRGVAGLGVGLAGKSTAGNIWTRSRGQESQMPRTITIPFVVRGKRDSSKRNIVEGGTVATVQKDGNSRCLQVDVVVAPLPSA